MRKGDGIFGHYLFGLVGMENQSFKIPQESSAIPNIRKNAIGVGIFSAFTQLFYGDQMKFGMLIAVRDQRLQTVFRQSGIGIEKQQPRG